MLSHPPTTDKFILPYHYGKLVGAHSLLPLGCALKPRDRAHPHHAAGIPVGCYKRSDNPKGFIRMLFRSPVLNSFQKVETFRSSRKCGGDEIIGYHDLVTLRVQNREASLFPFRDGRRYRHELTSQRQECKLMGGCVHENTTINSYSTAFKILHRADPPFILNGIAQLPEPYRSNHCYIICLKMCIFTNSMIPLKILLYKKEC